MSDKSRKLGLEPMFRCDICLQSVRTLKRYASNKWACKECLEAKN